MGAVSDIQQWLSDYKKLYALIDRFTKSPEYQYFTKSDNAPELTSFAILMRSWKSRVGTFESSKWAIEGLSDSDINSAELVISKDFFNKVASETRSNLNLPRVREYVEKGIEFINIAYKYGTTVDKTYGGSYKRNHSFRPAELVAVAGASMIMMALQPYHLFAHFAWHSTNTHKHKTTEQIIIAHYEFFTEMEWAKLTKYTDLTVRDDSIPKLVEKLTKRGSDMETATSSSEISLIDDKFEKVGNFSSAIKIISNNVSRLFIDTYEAK